MMMRMEYCSFNLQSKLGFMEEEEEDHHHNHSNELDSISSSSDVSSVASLDSDLGEDDDVTSSVSSSASSSSVSGQPVSDSDPLHDMSDLLHQLPIKRGLSKHFQGKSQSFTSLSNVRCLEDLAKPENPFNKKMKSCKSYAVLSSSSSDQSHRLSGSPSRLISKKGSRGSCSSLSVMKRRDPSCLGNKMMLPPTVPVPPPCRSASTNSFANQTPLFT